MDGQRPLTGNQGTPPLEANRLIGATTFGWSLNGYSWNYDLDINGQAFTDITGGNAHFYDGAISGTGTFTSNGGGGVTLGGSTANTFTGTWQRPGQTLILNKTAGVDALNGTVRLTNSATLQWNASNQANDATAILMDGTGTARLNLNAKSDAVGALTLSSYGFVDMGVGGAGALTVADSSAVTWDGTKFIKIDNWSSRRFQRQLWRTDYSSVGSGLLQESRRLRGRHL